MISISPQNTAIVVVWYNPTAQHIEHIKKYADAVKQIYIIDNSTQDNTHLANEISNTTYIANQKNTGIATALNIGYLQAIQDNHEWIISFDQDSYLSKDVLHKYMQLCNACKIPNAEIFAPYPSYGNDLPVGNSIYEKRNCIITSGALMSAKTYLQIGRYRDDFFIDLVDDEFCLRAKRLQKEIVMIRTIILEHHLGNGFIIVPIIHHKFVEHSALRHYYIIRNTLTIIREYSEQRNYYRKQIHKRIKRLLLYDFKDKWKKIKMCLWGYYDYKHNNMNQFNH